MSVGSFSRNPFVGFGCAGFRSFTGGESARIGPFDKVQVVSGQNNCGKSALIDYFIRVIEAIDERGDIRREDNPLTRADVPLRLNAQNELPPATISICVNIDDSKRRSCQMPDHLASRNMRNRCSNCLTTFRTFLKMEPPHGLISLLGGDKTLLVMTPFYMHISRNIRLRA